MLNELISIEDGIPSVSITNDRTRVGGYRKGGLLPKRADNHCHALLKKYERSILTVKDQGWVDRGNLRCGRNVSMLGSADGQC